MAARGATGPLSGRTLTILASLLGVAVLALSVAAGWLGFESYQARRAEVRRQAVLQAARQEATNLMSISYKTLDRDIDRIIGGATGSFKKQLSSGTSSLQKRVKKAKSISKGEVLATGVKTIDKDSAEVLVVVDATVRNVATPKNKATPRHYRLKFSLRHKNDRWLVSKIDIIP